MASAEYEAQRNALESTAAWTVKLSFPAFDGLDAKIFRWATTELDVDDEYYEQLLDSIPRGRHQRDRGNDYAEFGAINPNNATYNSFYEYEDLIEKAEVEIKECYEISTGYFESEVRFFGYLKDFSMEDASLKFTAMSDLSRTGFLVGGKVITRERCGANFNIDGLLAPASPDWDICGWQTIQGGNPDFCTKYADGVDGCKAHNNFHKFFAIKGLSQANVEIVTTNPSGFPYGTGSSCFISGTLILMADWSLKPIEEIRKGDYVLGFDVFTDKLEATEVLDTMLHFTNEYEKANFATNPKSEKLCQKQYRNFGVTKEHLFYKGSAIFKPYGALDNETVQGVTVGGKRAEIASVDSETVYGMNKVYNIHTGLGTYLISSWDFEIIIKVHNAKNNTTVQV